MTPALLGIKDGARPVSTITMKTMDRAGRQTVIRVTCAQ